MAVLCARRTTASLATPDTVHEPVPFWAKIPHGIWLEEATSVAVDSDDWVYVFNRGNMPILVFDPDGNLVDTWGNDDPFEGTELFEDPYGWHMPSWKGARFQLAPAITIDDGDNLWLVDDNQASPNPAARLRPAPARGRRVARSGRRAPPSRRCGSRLGRGRGRRGWCPC